MANEPRKCAHEGCTCVCADGKKYCSSSCEQQTKAHTISLGCDCPHTGCKGHL